MALRAGLRTPVRYKTGAEPDPPGQACGAQPPQARTRMPERVCQGLVRPLTRAVSLTGGSV